ncbi:zincin [Pholiota conissans]|uniref:Zincin n=1 Tax=Pholiota conissans TaxID=109636 RepID=A0A9P5Z9X5_9AGAR|nr:zincin [Pholiota conissans]
MAAPATSSSTSVSSHSHGGRKCGTHISAARKAAHEAKFARVAKQKSAKAKKNPVIDVHFHVVAANKTRAGGWIASRQIHHQIDVLNRDFHRTGIRYKLANTTHTISKSWFLDVAPDSVEQTRMKESLRSGSEGTLNIYTVSFANTAAAGLLGYSTFPADYQGLPKDDGVVIQHETLPGGSLKPFNKGRTATHEVGHWVGLYHTFQGESCTSTGDMVADTPVQKSPTSGCPKKRPDTCPGQKGLDAIHNYMDYSDDACLNQFTPGQATRMRAQLRTYRGINV